ncbi:MAG: tetratricopeptide repeat protein [Verrucomicrobia bacterium]|nr:tetratricopeptide repeat protein [Verrucomicrobiota bacterium]MDA1066008.1 tetratricopeptide repeat protein [Verrucomicrobiota bacterium]
MKAIIKEFLIWICLVCLCQFPVLALDELPFILPTDPDGWREDDFEKRFKGSYGINSYLEPELDVDNFNVYEGVLAFLDNSEGAITFITNSMATLEEQGIEVSASLHFLLGNFFFESDEHDLAEEQYILAIHKHPNFLRAYENLGYSFMQNDQNEKALPVLLKALELGSNDSQIHGLIGFLYLDKELYLSALSAFESAMLFNPRNNTWRFGIFQSLINLNRNDSALGVAEEILLFDPDNPVNWQNVASLLMRLNREDEVISHVEMVHQLGGSSYRTHRLLGNLYFNREMVEQANLEFKVMIDLASEAADLEDVLEVCEGMLYFGFVEEAQSLFGKLTNKGTELGLVIDPESTDMIQAMFYMEDGRLDQAETIFLRVLNANPAQPRALLFLAQILVQQRDFDQAGIYFELAQMYPEVSYNAYYAHAQLLLGLEQREEALAKLRQAQSIDASDELSEIISSLEETGRLIR